MQTCAVGACSSAIISNEQEVWVKGTNVDNLMGTLPSNEPSKNRKAAESNQPQISTKLDFPHPIISVCVGAHTSLFLAENGEVWTCGISVVGRALDRVPRQIPNLPPIQAISCSTKYSYLKISRCLFLDADGNVWKCDSTRKKYEYGPRKIGKSKLPPIKSISAASRFSLFLDHEGNVWSQGNSSKGCLGFEDTLFQKYPTKIPNLGKIVEISSSHTVSLFLDENGVVWSCGKVSEQYHAPLLRKPCKIKGLPPIRAISAGEHHSLFLDEEGRVWGRGSNKLRAMGSLRDSKGNKLTYTQEPILIPRLGEIIGIKAGFRASFYIDVEGSVWATGTNYWSQLNYRINMKKQARAVRKPIQMDYPPIFIPQKSINLKSARNT